MAPILDGGFTNVSFRTGPMLLGNLFAYGLYGILVVQVFLYQNRFPKDPLWIKALVWSVFFLDTIITVLGTIAVWDLLVAGWGNFATLTPLDWPFFAIPLLSGIVASCVHFFFCWRIWKLRGSTVTPITIAVISLLACGMASFCGVYGQSLGIVKLNNIGPYAIVWLGGSALVDMWITSIMVLTLFQARSRTSFDATRSLLQKLITLTIETGMVTCLAALAELILFLACRENNIHFVLFFILAKLYSNTLLATLNARAFIGQGHAPAPALWNDRTTSHLSMLEIVPAVESNSDRRCHEIEFRNSLETASIKRTNISDLVTSTRIHGGISV